MNVKRFVFLLCSDALIIGAIGLPRVAAQQQMSKTERESAESMLQTVASDIKKHYYDPNLHGLPWDAMVAEAKQKIDESASFDMGMLHIAALVDALNDSHTTLIPPRTAINASHGAVSDWRARLALPDALHDYGWRHEIVGERCFVTHVRPGSDAAKKGLHVGDEILSLNGYNPARTTIQRADYVLDVLRPQPELTLEVMDQTGVKSHLTITAKVRQVPMMSQYEQGGRTIRAYEELEHLSKPRVAEFGGDLLIIKVLQFSLPADADQSLIDKARKNKALILDLRG